MEKNLGLKRGVVKLMPHNPGWQKSFEEEKQKLKESFGDTILAIEHVGSTAIPGISAKPILDINIGVKSLEVAKAMKDQFEQLGYEHRPFKLGHTKQDLKWQELYVKGSEAKRTHHAHVTIYDNDYWCNDLLFRDYLKSHPDIATKYDELKIELAKKYKNIRESYTKGKEKFIQSVVDRARKKMAQDEE